MKTPRSPNDDCLLCKINKADKKGSHYTPAGIIKREIGKRDHEELYTINSFQASTSVFKGRSNLENTDTTIRKNDNVEDYIFCTSCENYLAIIENECNEKVIDLTDALVKGNLAIDKTKQGNKYISIKKPNKNILILYFYSIIWRQCLQQNILFQSIFLTKRLCPSLFHALS